MDTEAAPDEIKWRVHPLTENAWRSLLLVAIILAASLGVWSWTALSLGVLALIFLVVSMAPFFFPTHYSVDSDGIEIIFLRIRTFRGWEEYRNFYPHEMGVHLSTFKKPSRLDAFRGNFIRFAPGNREQVLEFLGTHIERVSVDREKSGELESGGEFEEK